MISLYETSSIITEGSHLFAPALLLVLEPKNNTKIGLYLIVCRVTMNDNSGPRSGLRDCGCDAESRAIVVSITVC